LAWRLLLKDWPMKRFMFTTTAMGLVLMSLTATAQTPGSTAVPPPIIKDKGEMVRNSQTERSDFRQAGGQGGGKQGAVMFKEGGGQERAQGEKGKPGGPQYQRAAVMFKEGGGQERAQGEKGKPGGPQALKMTREDASLTGGRTLDIRSTPNAGVTGRPQAEQMPSADALKAAKP
jgi:hypothetical protein